ncbi:hypothetical protein EV189_3024 [Motilibacter rhizosphaerae]|uniref:Uncharacterized protein n=1 Tax=Motilibacter rhizosphaerae TaxID=598652 RepID=A0A4Q7NQI9_9ACTN|nr:hypothetical protein [Motilibacter rhizosphaerae]RZS87591.1 hypothetical protein EV189_3024 [Motilibacter rhizosphaerae]
MRGMQRQELVRLDGAPYAAASRLATEGAAVSGTLRRGAFALRHAGWVPAWLRLVAELPVQDLPLSGSAGGRAIRSALGTGGWRARSASHAVLELPASVEEYLRGSKRQAVRTNVRRASAAGYEVARRCGTPGHQGLWEVRRAGGVVATATAVLDREVVLLQTLLKDGQAAIPSEVRYLLHTEVVSDLIADGVRFVVVEAVLGMPPGLKYFGARLGYEARRVRLVALPELAPVQRPAVVDLRQFPVPRLPQVLGGPAGQVLRSGSARR